MSRNRQVHTWFTIGDGRADIKCMYHITTVHEKKMVVALASSPAEEHVQCAYVVRRANARFHSPATTTLTWERLPLTIVTSSTAPELFPRPSVRSSYKIQSSIDTGHYL